MLNTMSKPLVKMMDRYLPDAYVFVLVLTIVVFIAALFVGGNSPIDIVNYWGDGFWGLLSFSMQMVLVLVTGFMMASTPFVKSLLDKLADKAKTPGQAILLVSIVALIASWINWGFGLVVGALFAKALARKIKVDYRLLVASAYSGFIVWHGGLAGSVPLTIATPEHFMSEQIGIIGTGETIFAFFNLAIVIALFIVVPLVNRAMLPKDEDSVYVDPKKLEEGSEDEIVSDRPSERIENSPILSWIIGALGLVYLVYYFFINKGGLNLNVINFLFLIMAIIMHKTPRGLLNSLHEAIKGSAGIVIQFPFYAGLMSIMVGSGLAAELSQWFVSFASETTLPFWTFISAGVLNIFVPSGGGQWAVQAPVVIPATLELGAEMNRVAMSVAWGDAWTNMIQPFWALPVLGIAGLKARDIMGFCLMHLIISGIIISLGLTFL